MRRQPLAGHTKTSRAEPARAWQRMLSGRRLDLLDPSPLDIEIGDIAHGLARVARWNGQTRGDYPYSVAQHSLLVEALFRELAPRTSAADALAALLHDAPEYVVGDLISPFKAAVGEAYREVEGRIADAVALRFSIPLEARRPALIKAADREAAYHEAVALAGFDASEAKRIFGGTSVSTCDLAAHLEPRPTGEVETAFLRRFEALQSAIGQR